METLNRCFSKLFIVDPILIFLILFYCSFHAHLIVLYNIHSVDHNLPRSHENDSIMIIINNSKDCLCMY